MEFSGSETESPVFPKTKENKSPKSHESGKKWPRKNRVTLEGYVESDDVSESGSSNGVGRTKSLTDEDLEELKGCLDLGFGFSYDEIPELCSTLPALELCYSMSQRFLDDQRVSESSSSDQDSVTSTSSSSSSSSPLVANWKFSSPGDDPDEVKARLKYWAQAVACTVRLCS
ncbi:uncharacterized protein LOC109837601 [Asparagus officinalis]|uniref:uncharacterized protein LOC109837601 n=1 Tax=Asparagus officinalis TaxID=4686 RepID=UPI00098E7260|nr:uncharacterized protein LOC109837601 [Asparagus officinalis]